MPVSHPVNRETRVIFSRGERVFTAKEMVDAALVRGEIAPLWADFMRVLDCERQAEAEGLELDETALDSASVQFRYDHDLITAEETERWLEDRGLSLADFTDYFARHYWAKALSEPVNRLESRYETGTEQEKDLFLIDLILSDRLDRMADRLAFRIAALSAREGASSNAAEERARFLNRAKIDRTNLGEWLAQIGRDEEWLNEIVAANAAFDEMKVSLINEQALAGELIPLRLNLTRFELESVEVDTRDAASEVIACVRSDGMEMAEVAQESRYPFHRSEVLLEDVPADQQQRFLSVRAGALFEPIPRGDGYEVWRVITRTEPSLQDPAIRDRLERRIIERHFSELISRYVEWRYFTSAE